MLSQAAESDLLADAESEVAEAAEELAFRVVVFSMQAWRRTCADVVLVAVSMAGTHTAGAILYLPFPPMLALMIMLLLASLLFAGCHWPAR